MNMGHDEVQQAYLHVFQRRNVPNENYLEYLNEYVKVIESYWWRKMVNPSLVKSRLFGTELLDMGNPRSDKENMSDEEVKEEYIARLIIYEAEDWNYGTIKTDLENKITCVTGSYPQKF